MPWFHAPFDGKLDAPVEAKLDTPQQLTQDTTLKASDYQTGKHQNRSTDESTNALLPALSFLDKTSSFISMMYNLKVASNPFETTKQSKQMADDFFKTFGDQKPSNDWGDSSPRQTDRSPRRRSHRNFSLPRPYYSDDYKPENFLPDNFVFDAFPAAVPALASAEDSVGRPLSTRLDPQSFVKKTRELWEDIDKNRDNYLSPAELAEKVTDKSISGEDAQCIATLYGARSQLKGLNNDGSWFVSSPGISVKDMNKFQKLVREQKPGEEKCSSDYLNSIDKNQDLLLSSDELKTVLDGDKSLSEDMRDVMSGFIKANDLGSSIKITDALKYFVSNNMGSDDSKTINKVDFLLRRTWDAQQEENSLWGKGGFEKISAEGLEQGCLTDCYALATFASIAEANPQLIKQMIKDNGNGTYTVTFPGAKDEPQTVAAPTETERGVYNNGAGNGTWGSILEKAYGQYCQQSVWRRTLLNTSGGRTPSEGADGGALRLGHVLEIVTGKNTNFDILSMNRDSTTRHRLQEALCSGDRMSVIASTGTWSGRAFDVTRHVYAILGYDPNGKDGGTLTMFNPWGVKEQCSFEEFSKRFKTIAYQTEKWDDKPSG